MLLGGNIPVRLKDRFGNTVSEELYSTTFRLSKHRPITSEDVVYVIASIVEYRMKGGTRIKSSHDLLNCIWRMVEKGSGDHYNSGRFAKVVVRLGVVQHLLDLSK